MSSFDIYEELFDVSDGPVYDLINFLRKNIDSEEELKADVTRIKPYCVTRLFSLFDAKQCLYMNDRDRGFVIAHVLLENNKILKICVTNPYAYGYTINIVYYLFPNNDYKLPEPMNPNKQTNIEKIIDPVSIEQIIERAINNSKHNLK